MPFVLSMRLFIFVLGAAMFPPTASPLSLYSAPPPPPVLRGYNSWYNAFGAVNETEALTIGRYMRDNLLSSGYDTLTIDEGWAESPPGTLLLDAWGRPTWDPARYPHGLPWLSAQLRAMGIRLGVWLIRGVPRAAAARALPVLGGGGATCADIVRLDRNCSWSSSCLGSTAPAGAAAAYYASVAASLVEMGVSFAKVDCLWPHLYEGVAAQQYFDEDVAAMTEAFSREPSLTLSMSPGISVSPRNASWIAAGRRAATYRIAEDVLDVWAGPADGSFPQGVRQKFDKALEYEAFLGPAGNGTIPDFDMLQLGAVIHEYGAGALPPSETRLTRAEQLTEFALFCFVGVPLIMGGRLPLDDNSNGTATLRLLTHGELLAVHGRAEQRRSFAPGGAAGEAFGWVATPAPAPAARYLAIFNAEPAPAERSARFAEDAGLSPGTEQVCLRDVVAGTWREPVGGPLPGGGVGFTADVEAHGTRAFLITAVGDATCRTGLAEG